MTTVYGAHYTSNYVGSILSSLGFRGRRVIHGYTQVSISKDKVIETMLRYKMIDSSEDLE